MFSNRCPFCDRDNPASSKFCGACGGALHLKPCPNCGAVTDVAATVCYQCRAPLRPRTGDALDDLPPPAGAATASQFTNLLKGLAAGGDLPPPDIPGQSAPEVQALLGIEREREASSARANETPSRLGPRIAKPKAAAATPPAADAAPAPGPENAAPSPAAETPGECSPAAELGFVPGFSNSAPRWRPRVALGAVAVLLTVTVLALLGYHHRQRAVDTRSLAADTAAPPAADSTEKSPAPIKGPQPIGKADERAPARPDGCTEAMAALGLCPPQSAQKPAQKAETAADRQAAASRPSAPAASKAGARQPPGPEPCTPAAAALGICVPQSPPSKE